MASYPLTISIMPVEYRIAILRGGTEFEVVAEVHLKTNLSKLLDSLERVVRLLSSCLFNTLLIA